MAQNYARYLNDKAERNKDRKPLNDYIAQGVGIAAAVGVGVALYKSGALKDTGVKTGKWLSGKLENARAVTNAISKTMEGRSVLRFLDDNIQTRIQERVEGNLTELYLKRAKSDLKGVPSAFERDVFNLASTKEEMRQTFINGLRADAINVHLKDSKFFADDTIADKLHEAMIKDDSWIRLPYGSMGNKPDTYRLQNFLKEHKIAAPTQDPDKALADLQDILTNRFNTDTMSTWINDVSRDGRRMDMNRVNQHFGQIDSYLEQGLLEKYTKNKNTVMSDALSTGSDWRQMTVEEAYNRGYFGTKQRPNAVKDANGRAEMEKTGPAMVDAGTNAAVKDLIDRNSEFGSAIVDRNVFIHNKTGEVADLRAVSQAFSETMSFAANNFEIPFVKINPLRLFHHITFEGIATAPEFQILKAGTKQPWLMGTAEDLASDIIVSGSKAYDLTTGKLVKENIDLASAKYGMFNRIASNMMGYSTKEASQNEAVSFFQNLFDVGLQEQDNAIQRSLQGITKFTNPDWMKNQYSAAKKSALSISQVVQDPTTGKMREELTEQGSFFFKSLYKTVSDNVKGLNDEALEQLSGPIKRLFPYLADMDLTLKSEDEVIDAMSRIVRANSGNQTQSVIGRKVNNMWFSYESDQFGFLNDKFAINQAEDIFLGITKEETNLVSNVDLARRAIHQEIVSQLEGELAASGSNISNMFKQGAYTKGTTQRFTDLSILNNLDRVREGVFSHTPGEPARAMDSFMGWLTKADQPNDKFMVSQMDDMMNRFVPLWAPGPASPPPQPFGKNVKYLAINKSRNPLTSANEVLGNGGGIWDAMGAFMKDSFGQLGIDFGFGYRAGRDNLGDVSTATAIAYNFLNRINEGLAGAGLGLSPKNLGSLQDIWKNLTLTRMVYPAAAFGALSYMNYESGNLLGEKPSNKAIDTYANMSLDVAWLRDKVGLTQLGKWANDVMPGINQITEEAPWAMVARGATFGLLGNSKSEQEQEKEFMDGTVPIRKGRWWDLGNTPWQGGKVEYYSPDWYRRIRSDYKYTDVMYGSEGEYWAHTALPNPRNAFGLNYLLQPDWYANKHRQDRPYPSTGGIEELRMLPIIGPIVDATIGHVINPTEVRSDLGRAHRRYLTAINESIKTELDAQRNGAYAMFTPSGMVKIVSGGTGGTIPVDVNMTGSKSKINGGIYIPSAVAEGPGGFIPVDKGSMDTFSAGPGGPGAGAAAVESDLTAINENLRRGTAGMGYTSGGLSALRNLDYMDNIMDAGNMSDISFQLAQSRYSTAEILGMYGFMPQAIFNRDARGYGGNILADARSMTSLSRSFWDLNLGGFGGDISEIGRRFIPRELQANYYNPYKNKMPGWMPGCFVAGTKVFTSDGSKDIETLDIGDKVMTHNGRFMSVQWVNVRNYNGKFMTIEVDGLPEPIKCTEEHPFLVMKSEKCDIIHGLCTPFINPYKECENCTNEKYSTLRWVPACDIDPDDFVVEAFPVSEYTVDAIPVPEIPGYEPLFRNMMPLNFNSGVVCGAYAADSSIDNGLALCYNYDDIVGDFCYHFNIQPKRTKQHIIIDDYQINQCLSSHFRDNKLPNWIYNTPDEFKIGFMAAYIDIKSNGRVSKREIQITNPPDGMHQLLGTMEIYVNQYSDRIYLASDEIYRLRILSGAFGKLTKFAFDRKSVKHIPSEEHFILHKVKSIVQTEEEQLVYNLQVAGDHTYNVYSIAVHNSEYLIDFQHGDPYAKIKMGEARLPGSGYEALNNLHSDPIFGRYGALERMKILGDVAPYSTQYRYYKKMASLMNQAGILSDQDKLDVQQIKDQVRKMREPFEITPYKFKGLDIQKQKVHVKHIIDNNLFVTEEDPLHPIRLAGIKVPNDDSESARAAQAYLSQFLFPGAEITIGVNGDAPNRLNGDTFNSIKAVVYDKWGNSVTNKLARMEVEGGNQMKIKDENLSPVDVAALYQPFEITIGKMWETFAHLDTPFHTKFLQVRSGYEMYVRRDVYGKSFQSWNHPINDYIVPTFQAFSRHNPVVATALGAFLGGLFGAKGPGRKLGAWIGGTVAGSMAVMRVGSEVMSDGKSDWIPKRRRKEREVEEYFDMIKYIKFKALYERTAQLAERKEGINIQKLFRDEEAKGSQNSKLRRGLEKRKQTLKLRLHDPMAYSDRVQKQLDYINEQLGTIETSKSVTKLGPLSLQALRYKEEYESTLYGMDQVDYMKIYKALPKRERNYFQSFSTAPPEERAKILRVLPENQRRLFQMMWGMKSDEKKDINAYFKSHNLPDLNWAGWKPDVSLDAIKVKVMNNEGVDIRDAGYWDDQPDSVRAVPNVNMHGMSTYFDPTKLKQVLKGVGLKDVDLQYAIGPAGDSNSIAINIDSHRNVIQDFISYINDRGIN